MKNIMEQSEEILVQSEDEIWGNSNKRDRAFRRNMRHKHIARKKSICNSHSTFAKDKNGKLDFSRRIPMDWYEYDGQYSKGKIHCSCGLCKFGRKYGLPTLKDRKEKEIYNEMIKEAV